MEMEQSDSQALTVELDINLTVNELVSFKNFTKSSPFMAGVSSRTGTAEGQTVIVVGFLRIVVGSHFVDPQHHLIPLPILHTKKNPK